MTKTLHLGLTEAPGGGGLKVTEATTRWSSTTQLLKNYIVESWGSVLYTTALVDFGWPPPVHELPAQGYIYVTALTCRPSPVFDAEGKHRAAIYLPRYDEPVGDPRESESSQIKYAYIH